MIPLLERRADRLSRRAVSWPALSAHRRDTAVSGQSPCGLRECSSCSRENTTSDSSTSLWSQTGNVVRWRNESAEQYTLIIVSVLNRLISFFSSSDKDGFTFYSIIDLKILDITKLELNK